MMTSAEPDILARIKITSGEVSLICETLDTPTAEAVLNALPMRGRANIWGAEVYFAVPVECELEPEARDLLEWGEIAYWPPGNAICVCFGATPASTSTELRLASAANVFARTTDDVRLFDRVRAGEIVGVELLE